MRFLSAKKNLVVVLGSGILSDIPLEALSAEFNQVDLVNVIHLNGTFKILKILINVGLTTRDINGIFEDLYIHVQTGGMGPIAAPSATFPLLEEADLVIAASVLSQLPLCLLETAKNGLGWKGADLVDFSRGILQAHLTALKNLSSTVCMITEIEREYYEGSEIKEAKDPLFGLELEQVDWEWVWNITASPELSPRRGLRNKIIRRIRVP